jgi:ACS family hexuronate transporter-like MFS transporter
MAERPIEHLRWYIAGLLCLATALNYLDRQTLSILANTIQNELKLTDVQYSLITSSFLASYTAMYAVSGRLLDRFGTRLGFSLSVAAWSAANMLHALARTALQFSFFRFLLGIGESANFPAGVKVVSEWFPMRERALAVGIFNSGSSIGAAIAAPLVSLVALQWGWRWAFVVTGAIGFIWVLAWVRLYHLPHAHPRLSGAERRVVLSDEAVESEGNSSAIPLSRLLSMKETWGCVSARVFIDPVTYFLVFWIPKYLQKEQGFTLASVGAYAWIPYFALAIGTIVGGAIPHRLIARGWSVNRARKTVMFLSSCFIPLCYLVLTRGGGPVVAMVAISGLMFGHGAWGNITIPAEVFPKTVVGTVSGIGGTLGGLAGIATQLSIGWMVQNVSFTPVFVACGSMYMVSFILVHRLAGELGRIRKLDRQ